MTSPPFVRREEPRDWPRVFEIVAAAFERPDEARLVDAIRGLPHTISLVATIDDRIVGHILFTRVTIDGPNHRVSAAGLAPLAVDPPNQRQGIGSRLVRAGLDACRTAGFAAVVVVGHPEYYPKFGFVRGQTKQLAYDGDVRPEAFMVVELQPGALIDGPGVVKYHPEFSAF